MRVKENNLRLYKCDLCQRTYSEYDGKRYSHVSLYEETFGESYDCCPVCTKTIVDVMSILQNGEDFVINVKNEKEK
jgi:hypothetical protein